MVTIDDVALEAAVSKSTVSRCFGRPDSVNAATRERVLSIAGALGYPSRSTAVRSSQRRTGNIGVVVPDVSNPYFAPLLKAVQQESAARHTAMFVGDGGNDPRSEVDIARSMIGHVDGLLLASSRMDEEDVLALADQLPVVVVNREIPGVSGVVLASGEGMEQAVEHLFALGHCQIAYLTGLSRVLASVERLASLHAAAARLGVDVVELGPFQPSYAAGLHATDLVMKTECTAVIAYNDLTALGVMTRAAELGVVVGRDLSVIGFDGLWLSATSSPPLTTVAAPVAEAGTAAARQLFSVLSGTPTERHLSLPAELIVRASTGPASARNLDGSVA